jgi:hypothetical protein
MTMASIDWNTIEKHLRRQGWTLERTANRHVRAAPPDRSRPLVHFSNSAEPCAIHNTLAQLKASGFVWPPSPSLQAEVARERGDMTNDEWIEIHNAKVATEELERQMEAAKNAPLPPPPETEEQRVNRMFEELKEAKLHATLCKEQEQAAAAKATAAQQDHERAQGELFEAQRALREKKAAFDQLFVETAVAS